MESRRVWRKITLCFQVFLLIFIIASPAPKANANPALALGAVETGAIMFWGGAVLVAAAGTAVGLDPQVMDNIEEFGKTVWNEADEFTRNAITASVQGFESIWGTTKKYSLQWNSTAYTYLTDKWNEFFAAGAMIDSSTGKITSVVTNTSVIAPSSVYPPENFDLGKIFEEGYELEVVAISKYGYITYVYYDHVFHSRKQKEIKYDDNGNELIFPNALVAYNWLKENPLFQYKKTLQTAEPIFSDRRTSKDIEYNPLFYPSIFPSTIRVPALKGVVNDYGEVISYDTPNIGRVGNSIMGDIAINYPTYVGDTGTFTKEDAILSQPVIKIEIDKKIAGQMERRGWTEDSIEDTVNEPHETSEATNKANGEDATAYFNEDGSYVVVENNSEKVIQVSNKNDPLWIPDSTIKNPYIPNGGRLMSQENLLEDKAIIRGGISLFSTNDALELVQLCEDKNYNILGIDAFIITDTTTQPVMEHSVDFTYNSSSSGNWSEAKEFIQQKADYNFVFEIVYNSEAVTSEYYSPFDLAAYKAMIKFLENSKNDYSDIDSLLEYIKLSDNGLPLNSEVWQKWLNSL
ncbi:colicin E5-related ribonuclease [Paenibacillus sp. M1]|uniref:Colicin E5-related ribonuclease n=1 Tax=Paenibacillus haidiansis TaxID=1574488 RepID=A0ABU7VKB1_9BACL